MRTAPRAAAWAAWAAWICNCAVAGGLRARNLGLQSKKAGFGPLFFALNSGCELDSGDQEIERGDDCRSVGRGIANHGA